MSTITEPVDAIASEGRSRFYVRTALACIAIALLGFMPTYWIPLAKGTLQVPALAHVHALLFYGWLVMFWRQASLAASGRIANHRKWGVAGAVLAAAMCVVGIGMSAATMRLFDAAGHGPEARAFAVVPVTAVLLFGGLVAAAVLNVKRPETHKRLMLAATASLLQPAFARFFILALAPAGPPVPPPVFVSIGPGILADLVLLAGMIHDKRTRGRVHGAYWVALGCTVAVQVLRIPLSTTGAWKFVANALVAIVP
jgi:hypothetical protein